MENAGSFAAVIGRKCGREGRICGTTRGAVSHPHVSLGDLSPRVHMVTVTIGSDSRPGEEADPQWVTQEINRRRQDGQAVCVQVQIHEDGVAVALSTPSCSGGAGGGRAPNAKEQRILELWAQHRLNTNEFGAGELVAFLRQVRKLL